MRSVQRPGGGVGERGTFPPRALNIIGLLGQSRSLSSLAQAHIPDIDSLRNQLFSSFPGPSPTPCSNENTFNCSPAGPMQDSTNRSQQTTPGVDGAVRAASLDESHGRSKPASTHHLVIEGERGWLTCHRRRRTLSVFETARRALLRGAEYLARSRSGSHTHAGKGVSSGRHQDTLGQARARASARGGRLLGQRQRRPGTCLLHPRCSWSVSPA